ncbi:amidohydrolase family protein [Streptacidiphilus neutrinimicus]|uniref:amidohydrolase family protein n=1 Tax=Streptacidiphilus neutrinimicus TaxID=105420 RepID=UPI0005A7472F|nr:amidohydrolase family protein [Streptacidiphilus neutrinimicus]
MSRIDVHQHLLPPAYTRWLRSKGVHAPGGRELPRWTPQQAVALMDSYAVDTAVLSLSTPGTWLGDGAEAAAMARQVNEFGAELVKDRPDRFGYFATVPLPDPDTALNEAAHALDELAADGVVLLANTDGVYLGHPDHDPLLAELDRRSAVVFVHPSELPAPPVPGLPPFAADFLLDTTRAAASLVLHGVPRRYPNLRIILSHAGGFLPYAAHRIAAALIAETGRGHEEILEDLRSSWFDTALSGSPTALPSLPAFARPERVLFGSDWPFAPELAVAHFTGELDRYPGLDAAGHDAIDRDNPPPLFPRHT